MDQMKREAAVYDLMRDAMTAASRHDTEQVVALCEEATTLLGSRPRPQISDEIAKAHDAALDGRWVIAHHSAWQAIANLSFGFPPDKAVCPPVSDERPYDPEEALPCGHTPTGLHPDAVKFCPVCGAPTK